MNQVPLIAARIFNTPLMVEPGKLNAILAALSPRLGLSMPQVESREVDQRERAIARYSVRNSIATIPIVGTLLSRGSFMDVMSGAVTYGQLTKAVKLAVEDDAVKRIAFDISSPGGEVELLDACAEVIRMAGKRKHTTALINEGAFSAAYRLAVECNQIVAPPSASVGSIGVVWTHFSWEAANEADGVKVTHIHAGSKKVQWSPHFDLSDEAKNDAQRMVDTHYAAFVGAVAKARKISKESVANTQAGIFSAKEALKLGLIDRVQTIDEFYQQPMGNRARGAKAMTDTATVAQLRADYPDQMATISQQCKMDADAVYQTKAAALTAKAAEDERARIALILDNPAAVGRQELAKKLAFSHGMEPEAAVDILSAAALETQTIQAEGGGEGSGAQPDHGTGLLSKVMGEGGNPKVVPEAGSNNDEPAPAALWDSIIKEGV